MRFRSTYLSGAAMLGLLTALPTRAVLAQGSLNAAPERPAPGAIVRLTLADPGDSTRSVHGHLAGEPLHFTRVGTEWRAIGGIPTEATGAVSALGFITRASGRVDTVRAVMTLPARPPVKREPLKVDSSFSRPMDAATAARVARENERAREVGRKSHDTPPLWTSDFLKPRESRVTSVFGTGRVFNGAVTSRHLGVDYAGAVGAPILAANRGVVALVDTFFLAGRVVYIDHGAGILTGYFHMSEQLVAVGDTVERGQKIGLVGNTGRVTGPHLHWSARYGATTVNPNDLLALRASWYRGVEPPK